jgi:hypothetical protein
MGNGKQYLHQKCGYLTEYVKTEQDVEESVASFSIPFFKIYYVWDNSTVYFHVVIQLV